MVDSRAVEISVGVFVATGLAALFMLALKVSNLSTFAAPDGYTLLARFDNIGGLKVRSPVTIAGVRIGRVSAIEYDQQRYEAVVHMVIVPEFNRLPEDSTAGIFTSGLLGEQYVGLEPGGAEEFLHDGSEIQLTQSALVLEQMIGKFLFQKAAE